MKKQNKISPEWQKLIDDLENDIDLYVMNLVYDLIVADRQERLEEARMDEMVKRTCAKIRIVIEERDKTIEIAKLFL